MIPRTPAPDFPVALRVAGRRVLLVGGGPAATTRARQLADAGAAVHVVAPDLAPGLWELARTGKLRASARAFRADDVAGAFVVFASAEDPALNRAVAAAARAAGILVNAHDMPEVCDFHVPSMGRRGPIVVAVSTSGEAPGLARALRTRFMALLGPEHERAARHIGLLRRLLPAGRARTRVFEALTQRALTGDR